jgi:Flp pilus assembly protein TadD
VLVDEKNDESTSLYKAIIGLLKENNIIDSEPLLVKAIGKYPHAPEPHNLMGIWLERNRNHILAMKHFRAAWSLDPTYLPARHNLELYGTFSPKGHCAFEVSDCQCEVNTKVRGAKEI